MILMSLSYFLSFLLMSGLCYSLLSVIFKVTDEKSKMS